VADVREHCEGADQHDVTRIQSPRREILCNGCGTVYLEPLVIRFSPARTLGAEAVHPLVPTPQELLDAAYEVAAHRHA
jgi:hypothetical protein